MQLATLDWIVLAAYFLINLSVGLYYRRRAGRSLGEFFVSDRSASWWLAGTSMVATTFAADTPLAMTGLVGSRGISGCWWMWSFIAGQMMTVFFYSRLWRRSGLLTDLEFNELRYSGRPAAFLRGFRAVYFSVPINCIVMGWVNLAMVKILMLTLGVTRMEGIALVFVLMLLAALVSALSGLRGVLVTDVGQFVLMLGLSITLAVFALQGVGGMDSIRERLSEMGREEATLAFLPSADSPWFPMLTFFVYVGFNWWASWYPGVEPGGGGYVVQRMLATRSERDSLLATLWFYIAHLTIRAWPWIIVGLVSLVAFPDLKDRESGYVLAILEFLPVSLRGLMLAGLLAAYMSTISTQLNWGASYLINDLYRRFLRPNSSDTELIRASRLVTVFLAVGAAIVSFYMDTIAGAWQMLVVTGAGTGGVYLLRWFWWRINAWSEVSAMIAALVTSLYLQIGRGWDSADPLAFAHVMLVTVPITTVVWLLVTLSTAPERRETLLAFYRRVRPIGAGWGPIAAMAPDARTSATIGRTASYWIAATVMLYGFQFGLGKFLIGELRPAAGLLLLGVACGAWLLRNAIPAGDEAAG